MALRSLSGARRRTTVRKRAGARSRPRAAAGRRRYPPRPSSEARLARYREAFGEGYREGVQAGIHSFGTLFDGTSIVIPTYNQLELLRMCIDSIVDNTDLPYEIIVVDNASTDGTADYLEKLGGQVRYRVLETNRGFAGAINVGMMMAKGSTILLLNNDTLATDNWLDNMLACLGSDESIGMVGPVTNYISGEQKIDVPYDRIEDMPMYAQRHNVPDSGKWRRTDRLTGFCLLFRRELFEAVGYFDEGYEIGNFEDDDFNIRVRLLGKTLMIAGDTFIHHFGSVSMKALGDRFQEVNDRNHLYFMNKWQHPLEWIRRVRHSSEAAGGEPASTAALYPERVALQGIGPMAYWIQGGVRRPIEGMPTIPVTRVSQIDLRRWPVGEPISSKAAERLWQGADDPDGELSVLTLEDGTTYYREGGTVRRIASPAALQAWSLGAKPQRPVRSEQLDAWKQGLPIISPPLLKQSL